MVRPRQHARAGHAHLAGRLRDDPLTGRRAAGVSILPPKEAHRAAWDRLYAGYAEFYEQEQSDEMRDRVWGWLLDPDHEVEARLAILDGELAGFAHYRPFARPLDANVGCFLDDLFVAPEHRAAGVATALIEAVAAEARRRGWSVVRWITAADNDRASRVYDRLATRTTWVTYDLTP